MPTPETFRALRPGPAEADGRPATLTVHDLGVLRVPSGRLEASDPFVCLGEGHVVEIPPGDYPVKVTVADVSGDQDGSHLREAYLSVVLAEGDAADVQPASSPGEDLPDGGYWAIGVDAGLVAFADAEAVRTSMPPGDWYAEVFACDGDQSWLDRLEAGPLRPGWANIAMPLATAGENVVLTGSGWGDGQYPVVRTLDAAGRLLAVHIDLLVIGDEAYDASPAPTEPAPEAVGQRGWLGRLLRRK
jgi:hypothetical protein